MGHHTKDRGDQGVACVTADLTLHDICVARPLSEHTPFDILAVSPDFQRVCRVSVKYRSMKRGGVTVPLKSYWADRHGTHTIVHDKRWYDALAIYCPDTHACYYVRMEEIAGVAVSLRVVHSRNNQRAHVRFAEDYRDPLRLFGLASGVVPGTPVGITAALTVPRRTVPVPDRRVAGSPPTGV